jgi:hypothetical protein
MSLLNVLHGRLIGVATTSFRRCASQVADVPDFAENALMLLQTIEHQIGQQAGMVGTYVDPGVNRALFAFLLSELDEKFEGVMADLEKVRIATLLPRPVEGRTTFAIVITHDEPSLLIAQAKQKLRPLRFDAFFLPGLVSPWRTSDAWSHDSL